MQGHINSIRVDAVLHALGQHFGLAGLSLDANGCCQLAFSGQWVVTLVLHPHKDCLVLHCPISTAGHIDSSILLAMLPGNFMGCATGGGYLAVSPDQRACVQQELPLSDLEVHAVRIAIDHVLAAARLWSSRLQSLLPPVRLHPALAMDSLQGRI